MLKEERIIDNMKVRSLCVKKDYYTNGTCKEYENLLFNLCGSYNGKKATIEHIEEIAIDILEHSDYKEIMTQYGCTKEGLIEIIAFELINDCCYTCVTYNK